MFRFATHIVSVLSLLTVVVFLANANTRIVQTDSRRPASKTTQTIRSRSGDSLHKIAERLKVSLSELSKLNHFEENQRLPKGTRILLPAQSTTSSEGVGEVVGNRITLSDGYSFEADEVWKNGDEIWFRKGNISQRLQTTVSSVKPILKASTPATSAAEGPKVEKDSAPTEASLPVWIHLVGGARFKVDNVQETSEGAWYNRGNLSIFLERERIARIEREMPGAAPSSINHDWTSGSSTVDDLIKMNAGRYGLDPYLIFLVIEHESHFRQRAVSPKGARGLMQLMPATANRMGVRNSFDPAQNIMGGSRYLKELLTMFGGRVDLALASYNAGEGAVMRFGRAVPPYKETRNYVKRITKRYGQSPPPERSTKTGRSGAE